ncbi:hypothetical protein UFOVP75_214 [uncultured Caudovirales phage]|uniref:Uncharacterized protein n=1 Tax=uncultured Caudovirales phage TaxID=2100421 RepID=A0A6J5L2P0_9CAUD|nr:hypothetical protein UFOVP75_214 [uncultured Caudovirales phage]
MKRGYFRKPRADHPEGYFSAIPGRSKGILVVTSHVDEEVLAEFRAKWYETISGVNGWCAASNCIVNVNLNEPRVRVGRKAERRRRFARNMIKESQ